MIRIGLTSFKEHDKLTGKKNNTLYEYAGFLPLPNRRRNGREIFRHHATNV